MVSELNKIPYGELPKMGMFARKVLNTKQKLGLSFKKKISKNLNEQLADELHKPIIRKFKKRKAIVGNIDDIWSAALVDMQQLKSYNHGFRYILNVIDVFSKYVWSVPIKDKTGKTITNAFQSIVKSRKRKPKKLWVDNGSEFYNNVSKKWLIENEIKMYSTFNEGKAVVLERFNRTLKDKMYKYFTANNTYKYVDVLPDLINEYNNYKHSTIKMALTEASMKYNEQVIQNDVYSIHDKTIYESKFMF